MFQNTSRKIQVVNFVSPPENHGLTGFFPHFPLKHEFSGQDFFCPKTPDTSPKENPRVKTVSGYVLKKITKNM